MNQGFGGTYRLHLQGREKKREKRRQVAKSTYSMIIRTTLYVTYYSTTVNISFIWQLLRQLYD
jgi:hypothetical protein